MHSKQFLRGFAAASILLLGACAYPVNGPEDGLPVEARFPITVGPSMQALQLPYDPARGGLDPVADAQLVRFARDYLENGSGAIAVSASPNYADAPFNIAGRLAALGVPQNQILLARDEGGNAANGVRITYIRYQAQAVPCGDWSANLSYTSANKPSPNFGCATQHNLAAMVADPRDLIVPKPMDPDDAQRRLTVLDKYRRGQTTVSDKTQEQTAAVSQVGQGM